jgi:hypothetical protein
MDLAMQLEKAAFRFAADANQRRIVYRQQQSFALDIINVRGTTTISNSSSMSMVQASISSLATSSSISTTQTSRPNNDLTSNSSDVEMHSSLLSASPSSSSFSVT